MIVYRRLNHEDLDDIRDISKYIWEGTDYLPSVFHEWVDDDKGFFMGAVDDATGKVIGVGKYSILYDGSGWLEGLRVHKDYRNQKIGKQLSISLFDMALRDYKENKIKRIAFATHASNIESISIMKKLGFNLEQQYILIYKNYNHALKPNSIKDFDVKQWNVSLQEFLNLEYFKKRANILPIAFVFQEPTALLYKKLKSENAFITINGHNGIFKLKGEPNFIAVDDDFDSINTFMDYFLLLYKDKNMPEPMTSIIDDKLLIDKLKNNNFSSYFDYNPDYYYFVYNG